MRAILIGAGNIGKELYKRLEARGDRVVAVARSDGIYEGIEKEEERVDILGNLRRYVYGADIGFNAIPNLGNGDMALKYMMLFLNEGVPIVTCEKVALANNFPLLRAHLDEIGFSATCGGGSGILPLARSISSLSEIKEVYAVVNGTNNYIMDGLANKKKLEDVVKEAVAQGYVEQGSSKPISVINNELCRDIPSKTAILYNSLALSKECVRARDIRAFPIEQADLRKIIREANKRRCLVTITEDKLDLDRIGGFYKVFGDFYLSGGFIDINKLPFTKNLLPTGVGNMIYINSRDGSYCAWGQGAGAKATVSAMLEDADRLLKKQKQEVVKK